MVHSYSADGVFENIASHPLWNQFKHTGGDVYLHVPPYFQKFVCIFNKTEAKIRCGAKLFCSIGFAGANEWYTGVLIPPQEPMLFKWSVSQERSWGFLFFDETSNETSWKKINIQSKIQSFYLICLILDAYNLCSQMHKEKVLLKGKFFEQKFWCVFVFLLVYYGLLCWFFLFVSVIYENIALVTKEKEIFYLNTHSKSRNIKNRKSNFT